MENPKQRMLAQALRRGSSQLNRLVRQTSGKLQLIRKPRFQSSTPTRRSQSPTPINHLSILQPVQTEIPPLKQQDQFQTDQRCLKRPQAKQKPFSLLIIQNYVDEICSSIQNGHSIPVKQLKRAPKMVKALDDTARALPNLSMQFYNLVRTILRELQTIEFQQTFDYEDLLQKLLELASFIYQNKYISAEHPVSKYNIYLGAEEEESLEEIKEGLQKRTSVITIRNLNILGKVLGDDLQLKKVVDAYLLLIREIDGSIQAKNVNQTPKFGNLAAKSVQATRRILEFIHSCTLQSSSITKIQKVLSTVDYQQLKFHQKSGTGVILYEFLVYTVKYFIRFQASQMVDQNKVLGIISLEAKPPKSPQKSSPNPSVKRSAEKKPQQARPRQTREFEPLFRNQQRKPLSNQRPPQSSRSLKKDDKSQAKIFLKEIFQLQQLLQSFTQFLKQKICIMVVEASHNQIAEIVIQKKQELISEFSQSKSATNLKMISDLKFFLTCVYQAFKELEDLSALEHFLQHPSLNGD